MSSNAQKLLAVLQDYAPTDKEQAVCSELIGTLFKQGLTSREIDGMLAGAIYDGIRYGNWPWTGQPQRDRNEALREQLAEDAATHEEPHDETP